MTDVVEPGQGRPLEVFKEIRTRENYEVNGSAVEAVVRAQARDAGEPTSVSSWVAGDFQYQYSNLDMRLIPLLCIGLDVCRLSQDGVPGDSR